jgi:hypothetical protein
VQTCWKSTNRNGSSSAVMSNAGRETSSRNELGRSSDRLLVLVNLFDEVPSDPEFG